jgi:hypothetical protein
MKPIKFTVIAVTIYLFVYAAMPFAGAGYNIMFFFFLIGNFLLLYMVYSVLKWGIAPKEKFDDGYWYSDIKKKYSTTRD